MKSTQQKCCGLALLLYSSIATGQNSYVIAPREVKASKEEIQQSVAFETPLEDLDLPVKAESLLLGIENIQATPKDCSIGWQHTLITSAGRSSITPNTAVSLSRLLGIPIAIESKATSGSNCQSASITVSLKAQGTSQFPRSERSAEIGQLKNKTLLVPQAIEDISAHMKITLLDKELSKYCIFVDLAFIKDFHAEKKHRHYSSNEKTTQNQIEEIKRQTDIYKQLCVSEKEFGGFLDSANASERIITKILTVRALWAYMVTQDIPYEMNRIAGTYRQSFSTWERAFGQPETLLWRRHFALHSRNLTHDQYDTRLEYLQNEIKKSISALAGK